MGKIKQHPPARPRHSLGVPGIPPMLIFEKFENLEITSTENIFFEYNFFACVETKVT